MRTGALRPAKTNNSPKRQSSTSSCCSLDLRSPALSPCLASNRLRVSMTPITTCQTSQVEETQCRAESQQMECRMATRITTLRRMKFRTCAQSSKCLIQIARVPLKSKTWRLSWAVCSVTQMKSESSSIS